MYSSVVRFKGEEIVLKANSDGGGCGAYFGGFFILFWTTITLSFDFFIGAGIYNQTRAKQFETAQGKVLISKVESHSDSDGTTYKPIVHYEYEVDGKRIKNDVIRFQMTSSNDPYAREFVKSHPVGKQIDVYYNPERAEESVLVRGVEGADLFILMFMTPFNLVMLTGWYIAWNYFFPGSPAGYVNVRDDGQYESLRLNSGWPVATGAACLGGLAFAAIFLIGFTYGFHPPLGVIQLVWFILLAVSCSVSIWIWRKDQSGRLDLVRDKFQDTLRLPNWKENGREGVRLAIQDVVGAVVRKRTESDGDGGTLEYHEVFLELSEKRLEDTQSAQQPQDYRVSKDLAPEKAQAIVDWLNRNWFGKPHQK